MGLNVYHADLPSGLKEQFERTFANLRFESKENATLKLLDILNLEGV